MKIPIEQWTLLAAINRGKSLNRIQTSNLVEQMNSRILPLRFMRVFDFLVEMSMLVMKEQYKRLQLAEKWLQQGLLLTPFAQREYDLQKVGSSSF